jgi:uncharacterized membrane protein
MKQVIDAVIAAILIVMVLNIVLNSKNSTTDVVGTIGSNTNTIFGTLLKPGG